jgi:ankyrin repeat protein
LYGHKEIAITLLNNNANIMAIDENDHTPLHIASSKGHRDIVVELLKQERLELFQINCNDYIEKKQIQDMINKFAVSQWGEIEL